MNSKKKWWSYGISIGVVAIAAVAITMANRSAFRERGAGSQTDATIGAPLTSRDGLQHTIRNMERRLREHPDDPGAAVSLADALLRQARVSNNPGLALR